MPPNIGRSSGALGCRLEPRVRRHAGSPLQSLEGIRSGFLALGDCLGVLTCTHDMFPLALATKFPVCAALRVVLSARQFGNRPPPPSSL